jgi:hypothetical protein
LIICSSRVSLGLEVGLKNRDVFQPRMKC